MKTEPKIKEVEKLTIGKMVVFRNVKNQGERVFYINEMSLGVLKMLLSMPKNKVLFREPTILEKEFCYWAYEKMNIPSVHLNWLPYYFEYKKGEPIQEKVFIDELTKLMEI